MTIAVAFFGGLTYLHVFGVPGVQTLNTPSGLNVEVYTGDPKLDPQIGVSGSELGVPVSTRGSTIVYLFGNCTSCSIKAADSVVLDDRPGVDQVGYLIANQNEIRANFKTSKRVRVLPDPNSKVHARLNDRWHPRWYIFKNGKLFKFQVRPEDRLENSLN